jgi:hypothetical protein
METTGEKRPEEMRKTLDLHQGKAAARGSKLGA